MKLIYLCVLFLLVFACNSANRNDSSSLDNPNSKEQKIGKPESLDLDTLETGDLEKIKQVPEKEGGITQLILGIIIVIALILPWIIIIIKNNQINDQGEMINKLNSKVGSYKRDADRYKKQYNKRKDRQSESENKYYRLEERIRDFEDKNEKLKRNNDELVKYIKDNENYHNKINSIKPRYERSIVKENNILKKERNNEKKNPFTLNRNENDSDKLDLPAMEFNKTLYFSVPESGGKFTISKGKENHGDKLFYKISYNSEQDLGKIEYLSGDFDSFATNHKDSVLKPVCKIIESEGGDQTTVINDEPGSVKRLGDKWVIDEKLIVRIR